MHGIFWDVHRLSNAESNSNNSWTYSLAIPRVGEQLALILYRDIQFGSASWKVWKNSCHGSVKLKPLLAIVRA